MLLPFLLCRTGSTELGTTGKCARRGARVSGRFLGAGRGAAGLPRIILLIPPDPHMGHLRIGEESDFPQISSAGKLTGRTEEHMERVRSPWRKFTALTWSRVRSRSTCSGAPACTGTQGSHNLSGPSLNFVAKATLTT